MKISVILPVYNAEKYVSAAIDSILRQTFTDFELLLINDASTDGSRAILQGYAAQDRRVRLIDNPQNLGLTATLNKAIDLCRGEYIARMDADDISLPQRLETQAAFLDANPDIGFCGAWVSIMDANGQLTGEQWVMQLTPELVHARMYFHNCFIHSTILMRSFYAQKKYDTTFVISQDYELWTRLSDITRCYIIPESLVAYRIHQVSMTGISPARTDLETKTIISKRLQKIGITTSPSLLQLHLSIGNQQLSPEPAFVQAAHDWLLQFWHAFKKHHQAKSELNSAMRQLLGKFWLAILTQEGVAAKIVTAYAHSPLSRQLFSLNQRLRLAVKQLL